MSPAAAAGDGFAIAGPLRPTLISFAEPMVGATAAVAPDTRTGDQTDCSPDERSEIRGGVANEGAPIGESLTPDFALRAHPGYD
jgi:hypothetical protein